MLKRLVRVGAAALSMWAVEGIADAHAQVLAPENTRPNLGLPPAQPTISGIPRPLPRKPPSFVSFGFLASFLGGKNPTNGYGGELSGIFYLPFGVDVGKNARYAIGPVLQYQSYTGPAHGRLGAGIEFLYLLGGLEVLYAYRRGAAGHADTHGLALGPFLSLFGIVHVAGRFTFALEPSNAPGWGNEYGVSLGLKLPLLIAGNI